MPEHIVDIHLVKRSRPTPTTIHVDDSLGKWFRPTLALAIEERGMNPVFSRGQEAYNFDRGSVTILKPQIEKIDGVFQVTVTPEAMALEGIKAIRNTAPALGNSLPELNDPSVRTVARDKVAANSLLDHVGLAKEYASVDDSHDIDRALQELSSDYVALKPRMGKGALSVYMGDKSSIAAIYNSPDFDKGKSWILEEGLDLSPPIPLRGLSAEEQAKIDLVNSNTLPKELRIYTFGRDSHGNLITSSVLRAAMPGHENFGENERIYIDPESIPEEVVSGTDKIAKLIETSTGVTEMHLGIDWAFAAQNRNYEPRWIPMEINGSEPVLVYEHENQEISKDQAGKLAEQLYRIAEKGKTGV